MKKKLTRTLIAMVLVWTMATPAFAAETVEVQYLEDGFEEISPNGCVYYSSNRTAVFSKDGLYLLSGDSCERFTSRFIHWVLKYQTDLGKLRAQKVKQLLSK